MLFNPSPYQSFPTSTLVTLNESFLATPLYIHFLPLGRKMGGCCSRRVGTRFLGYDIEEEEEEKAVDNPDDVVIKGHAGAHVLLQGSSKSVSMFSKQGKKGVNQDAMTVWESFSGDKEMFFCAVFDGHGSSGHQVARYIRDFLPAKLYLLYKQSSTYGRNAVLGTETTPDDDDQNPFFLSWKASFTKSFQVMDDQLEREDSIESYGSGSTSVCVLKKHEHLVIANLGDSRAVLCRRDDHDQLVPEQLTVDLKPSVPSEADRIRNCQGRVLATNEESNVYRVWRPNEDFPGLAMTRAFGDFCMKDYGVIPTPQVTYRKLTERDEFVVLASDGIWDALSNSKVVKTVASARNRSAAAQLVVEKAVSAWRYKYPCAKTDDCSVVCLFFNRQRPLQIKSYSEVEVQNSPNYTDLDVQSHASRSHDSLDTVFNFEMAEITEGEGPENGGDQVDSGMAPPRKERPVDT